jgi:hypothetical protein
VSEWDNALFFKFTDRIGWPIRSRGFALVPIRVSRFIALEPFKKPFFVKLQIANILTSGLLLSGIAQLLFFEYLVPSAILFESGMQEALR